MNLWKRNAPQQMTELQTGSGHAAFGTFAAFLADALAAAEHVGLRWPFNQTNPPSEQASKEEKHS